MTFLKRLPLRGKAGLVVQIIGYISLGVCIFVAVYAQKKSATPQKTEAINSGDSGLTLDEDDRKYLWEVEHHGAILQKYGFNELVRAIKAFDRSALDLLFATSFVGRIPADPEITHVKSDTLEVSRMEVSEDRLREVDSRTFTEWLLQHRSVFAESTDAKASLMSLAPLDREDLNSSWQGNCRLRLWGETQPGHPSEVTLYLHFELERPVQESLERGGWLKSCTATRVKSAQATRYLMRDVARQWGIDIPALHDNWNFGPERTVMQPGGVYLCDYNRDSLVDICITDVAVPRGFLFYKATSKNRFVDVTLDIGLSQTFAGRVTFVDLDGDGWEDLVQNDGAVYRNMEGRRFQNVSHKSNLASLAQLNQTWGSSKIIPADYDLDGQMDLYICRSAKNLKGGSWVNGKIVDRFRNQLLRNLGDWQFEDVTKQTRTDGGGRSVFTSVWLDANNDGRPDLYVIHEFGNGLLLVNQPDGTFREQQIVDGPADFGSMGVTCGDVDNDGALDIYVGSMYSKSGNRVIGNLRPDAYPQDVMMQLRRMVAGNQLYRNLGNLKFEPLASTYDVADVGWAYGVAFADLDNDGFLDIHATGGFISRTREKPDG